MLLAGFVFANSYSKGQNITLTEGVEDICNDLRKSSGENILVFYSDGTTKTGLILWTTNEKNFGIAFTNAYEKGSRNKMEIRNIHQKILKKCMPLNRYLESIDSIKENANKKDKMNHEYNVIWIYKADTLVMNMGTLNNMQLDPFASSLCLQYLRIHDLTMHAPWRWRRFVCDTQ